MACLIHSRPRCRQAGRTMESMQFQELMDTIRKSRSDLEGHLSLTIVELKCEAHTVKENLLIQAEGLLSLVHLQFWNRGSYFCGVARTSEG